jgi:hypothetical protein
MHAFRRHLCQAITILVFLDGTRIFFRNLTQQAARLAHLLHHTPPPPYPGCPDAYCDFSVFWLAGRLAALSGAPAVYHAPQFFAAATQMLPHEIYGMPFMYPPPMLPLIYLISRPPLAIGYYAFVLLGAAAAILLLRRAQIPWACIAAGLLGPAGLWCLYLGQFGILCTGILIAGLAALETRPGRAGALLAALCIKPQYALLAPVVILARRNPSALLGATLAGAALVALSIAGFGWSAWTTFLASGSDTIRDLLQENFAVSPGRAGTSAFWMARSLGAGIAVAYALQAVSAALAAVCAWQLWRRDDIPSNTRIAITLCLALLATPYGYTDDMVGYSIACALLMRRDSPATTALLALLWLAPAYIGHVSVTFGFLPTPLCIVAVALIGWRQAASRQFLSRPAPYARAHELLNQS